MNENDDDENDDETTFSLMFDISGDPNFYLLASLKTEVSWSESEDVCKTIEPEYKNKASN